MAAVIKAVAKSASANLTIPAPVGKKIYGITGVYGTSIRIQQGDTIVRMLDNSGNTRELWFPDPIEFAAATSFIFNGSVASTIGLIYEE